MVFSVSRQENRFRRTGTYTWDQLLKDLRELNNEVQRLASGVNDAEFAGPPGPRGPRGTQGTTGPKGGVGSRGQPGPRGLKGDSGQSAYEIAVDAGFTGSEADFVASLTVLQGLILYAIPVECGPLVNSPQVEMDEMDAGEIA